MMVWEKTSQQVSEDDCDTESIQEVNAPDYNAMTDDVHVIVQEDTSDNASDDGESNKSSPATCSESEISSRSPSTIRQRSRYRSWSSFCQPRFCLLDHHHLMSQDHHHQSDGGLDTGPGHHHH